MHSWKNGSNAYTSETNEPIEELILNALINSTSKLSQENRAINCVIIKNKVCVHCVILPACANKG